MKPSSQKLGLAIQLFLLRQGISAEALAQEMGVKPESLSNLIHGRRGFKDETLKRLATTPTFKKGHFSLKRLRALRAMDDYSFDEIILAFLESLRQGAVDELPSHFFQSLSQELAYAEFPEGFAQKQQALAELIG